ncbi:MAG: ABC transporter permease subunit [Actinomycetota bacterium]|nr:ABC transporter permease subunit [Actinomycetota bacterium]
MSTLGRIAPPLVAGVLIFGTWQLWVGLGDIEDFLLPAPSAIARALVDEWSTIWPAALATLWSAFAGLVVGAAAAVAMALLTVRFRGLGHGLTPLATVVAATPIVVLAPIANIWFGLLSPLSKISVVAVVTFFPVFVNVSRGLQAVPTNELELMRSYAAGTRATLTQLRVPRSLPLLFTGLKVAASLAMITTIVAEYFGGSRRRLGVLISQQASVVRFDVAWAGIAVACALALLLYGAVLLTERLVTPWHDQASER